MRNRLFDARKRSGLTLGQVQEYTGLSKSRLSELERDLGQPTRDTLELLADQYGVSVDWLLGRTDDPAQPARPRIAENGAAYVATYSSLPAWLDELADIANKMTVRGRAHLVAVARALAREDSEWRLYDDLLVELLETAPLELERLETLVQKVGRDEAARLLFGELSAALDAHTRNHQGHQD